VVKAEKQSSITKAAQRSKPPLLSRANLKQRKPARSISLSGIVMGKVADNKYQARSRLQEEEGIVLRHVESWDKSNARVQALRIDLQNRHLVSDDAIEPALEGDG
jgi:hypothetical protein